MTIAKSPFSPCQFQLPSFSLSPAGHELDLNYANLVGNLGANQFWSGIVNALPYGIIVMTPAGQLLYANIEAQALCPHLTHSDSEPLTLSHLFGEICDRWSPANRLGVEQLVMECSGQQHQRIRVKIQPLVAFQEDNDNEFILFNNARILTAFQSYLPLLNLVISAKFTLLNLGSLPHPAEVPTATFTIDSQLRFSLIVNLS